MIDKTSVSEKKEIITEKEEGFSLLLYLSHLCLVFPLSVVSFSEEEKKGSFVLKEEGDSFALEEWLDVFKFTFSYKLQSVVLGEEKTPFSSSARLISKKMLNNKIFLVVEFF